MKINRKQVLLWLSLATILFTSFFIRVASLERPESLDYHPDEWVLARPIYQIANQGQVGIKTHYKWSGCGVIYPVGYSLYFLKPIFGEYSYETILRTLRTLSATASVGAILLVFLFLRRYHSVRAAYIGAILLGISKSPVIVGHYGTLDSVTMLLAMIILFISYRFFHFSDHSEKVPAFRNFLFGMLIGWSIAIKWTFLLAAIPLFIAFISTFLYAARRRQKIIFLKRSTQQCILLGLGLILGFLLFFPDVQMVPNKVKEGLDYEIKHHKTGHYGSILADSGQLGKRLKRTYRNFIYCGWKALAITGLCSLVFVFFKRSNLKWYLFFCFLLWTYVPFRNLISPARHYLVPYTFLLLLLSISIDALLNLQNRYLRIATVVSLLAVIAISLLYTCVCISPFWQEDARVKCANWIVDNAPQGSGVSWAPRHNPYNWAVPGTRIAPYLFKKFPRQAKSGKHQYFIIAPKVRGIFKKHPPTRKIVPAEWFPVQPPTRQEILFFHELNQGGGENLELVKKFKSPPKFMGITLKFFGEHMHTHTTFASNNVELFKTRKVRDIKSSI